MNIISLDTIKVGFHIPKGEISFVGWEHHQPTKVRRKDKEDDEIVIFEFYICKFYSDNGTEIRLKYVPKDFYGRFENYLFIEFSIPKLIFGCNHRMIEDWESNLNMVNIELAKIPGLPPLGDIRDADLLRLDICVNFLIGTNVTDYIQSLRRARFPHRKSNAYPTGVLFMAKSGISTTFYDKYAKCGHKEATGMLRAEISMRKRVHIRKFTGRRNPTLRDLTVRMVEGLLRKDLKILHLDQSIICDRREIEQMLSKKYSPRRVRSMLGYLLQRQTLTHEQMIGNGSSRSTICYYEKLLREAGVSSMSLEYAKSLPPLTDYL